MQGQGKDVTTPASALALPRLYLFRCGDSPYFALSSRKYSKQHLPSDVGDGDWHFCQPVELRDLGSYYMDAVRTVMRDGYCILDLTSIELA